MIKIIQYNEINFSKTEISFKPIAAINPISLGVRTVFLRRINSPFIISEPAYIIFSPGITGLKILIELFSTVHMLKLIIDKKISIIIQNLILELYLVLHCLLTDGLT